jgi:thiamine-phosphate pyrophosphorylase
MMDKIIGASCYDDLEMAVDFEKLGATYVAFGAAFASKTKPEEKVLPTLDIFRDAKQILNIPVVAIGGIDENNYKLLLARGVDALAIASAIFDGDPYINARKFQV